MAIDWSLAVLLLLLAYLGRRLLVLHKRRKEFKVPRAQRDLTLKSLALCDGRDPFRALLIAVKGVIYDVSEASSLYGPGGTHEVYAGKECARALGKDCTKAEECTADLKDLSESELKLLDDRIQEFESTYAVFGKVVPEKKLKLAELKEYNGTDPEKPMYLAIKGTIFDISVASHFYGPDGMYPFAGHECARAMALLSTDLKDCNNNLKGLGAEEIDSLNSWYAKFASKYNIVGEVVV